MDLKIPDLIVNLIASLFYDISTKLINKFRFWKFKTNEKKWLEKFCNENDGTIIVSKDFEIFLRYHKPIECVFNFVLDTEYSDLSEKEFINSIVEQFKLNIQSKKVLNILEQNLIRDLLSNLLLHLKQFLEKTLTDSEKYSIYLQKQRSKKTDNLIMEQGEKIFNKFDEIINCTKIPNEKVEDFYQSINTTLLQGQLEIIYRLIPVIENKNDDLENGVKISLELISEYKIVSDEILNCYFKIKNDTIKNDICRKLILFYRKNPSNLEKLRNTTTNIELNEIIENLLNNTALYTEKVEVKNHIKFYDVTILSKDRKESRLINYICFLELYEKNISHIVNGNDLLNSKECFIDRLFELEEKHLKLLTDYDFISQQEIILLCEELEKLEPIYTHATTWIKNKYYQIFIRSLILTNSPKVSDVIQSLSKDVLDDRTISSLIMSIKIKNNNVTEDELIDFCNKSNEYTLINDYIREQKLNQEEIKTLLNKHIWLVKKDILLFIYYLQVTRNLEGNIRVQQLKQEYAPEYKDYLEYHLLTLDATDKETYNNDLVITFELWKSEKIKCCSYDSEIEFIRMLFNNQKYSEAWEVLSKQETMKVSNPMLQKYKAKLLLIDKKYIDALGVFLEIFDVYKEDPEIVDNILAISLLNAREIKSPIIEQALNLRTPRLLSLVANVYNQKGEYTEAKQLMKEALIKSPDATDICENYFYMITTTQSQDIEVINHTDVDTVVVLKNDTLSVIYGIHKNKFLNTEPYMWENSIHISEDTAIRMNLLNKKVDSQICIDNIEYVIAEIVPMEVYLTKICLDTMVKKGTAKAFSVDTKEDSLPNLDEFKNWIKDNTGSNDVLNEFIENYNDLSKTDIPLFLIHKATHLSHSELILAFLENKDTIFRDYICNTDPTKNGYILSTSAVITLYKIGVNTKLLNDNNVCIPESMQKQILQEIEHRIMRNKLECNATMGVVNDDVFIHEVSDEEKQNNLIDSVNLKDFVEKLKTIKNNADISIDDKGNIDYKDCLGISDYDAFSISLIEKHKFVSAESSLIGLSTYLNIDSSCILDFLCEINTPLLNLIEYMKNMLKYKILVIISPYCFNYILKQYHNLEYDEQEAFIKEWYEFFDIIEQQDDKYKEICTSLLNHVFKTQYSKEKNHLDNPIYKILAHNILVLNNMKLTINYTEEGKMDIKLSNMQNHNNSTT